MASHAELLQCMIASWYPLFRHVTFKTMLLPLPQGFVEYLVADGVHLADDSEALAKRGEDPYASDDGWDSEGGSSTAGSQHKAPEFPELVAQMRAAIVELGGVVVPKFTWSCPKDAVWMTLGQTLACRNPDEVLLLLKSSDRVAHDICHALEGCSAPEAVAGAGAGPGEGFSGGEGLGSPAVIAEVQHVLALRRWHDLRPEREFRCFVRGHELVGVSQRDVTEHYPSLLADKQEIQQRILGFHQQHIQGRFPLPHYTYDVYVAATADAVKLVDFNPVGGTTAPLLFSWEELPYGDVLDGRQGAAAADASVEASSGLAAGPAAPDEDGTGGAAVDRASSAAADEEEGSLAGCGPGAAYLEQLRQLQTLSLSEQPGVTAGSEERASCSCGAEAGSSAQQAQREPAMHAHPSTVDSSLQPPPFEFRIITEPVAMRPHKLAYGVPFDFADASEGSALDQLVKQMGEAPEELWAALRAQAR